jgi:glycosyltransferase involved in cell wall biosynthesis
VLVRQITHVIEGMAIEGGGPLRSLCSAIQLVNSNSNSLYAKVLTWAAPQGQLNFTDSKIEVQQLPSSRSARVFPGLDKAKQFLSGTDIIHAHLLWSPKQICVRRWAKKNGASYLLSPHGCLADHALKLNYLKKRFAWWLYARRSFLSADGLVVCSDSESQDCRDAGYLGTIFTVPNAANLCTEITVEKKRKTALFLGRIHPIKRVEELVAAWRKISPHDWKLVLAGYDDSGVIERLRLQLDESVEFIGSIEGAEKARLLAESSFLVLPSRTENFGNVVVEALSQGTPVLTSTGCPWAELETNGCGWWRNLDGENMEAVLRECLSTDLNLLSEMGRTGTRFIQSKYDDQAVARKLIDMYSSVLNSQGRF